MRLADWPRMPFLNEEVREWIGLELKSLGVEDLAIYALEAGREGDERRVMVATEVGLLDHRYAPYGSSARFRLAMLLYPWQVLRGVELRADTFRLWAHEHRTRWSFKLHHPHFEAATESPELGQALCDLARVCAVMAEPFGVPAGKPHAEAVAAAAAQAMPAPPEAPPAPRGAAADLRPVEVHVPGDGDPMAAPAEGSSSDPEEQADESESESP